jgi:Tfp pilus tip-associated adhesin PilY1
MVYPVQRLSGTIVLANTISPVSSADTDLCVQTGSGSGWAYIIDAITGSGPTKKVLDTNGDGLITDADALVSGWQDPVDGRPTAITIQQKPVGDKFCIVTAQNTCTKVELACGQLGMPACPQTPITGIKTREWRQIFMR